MLITAALAIALAATPVAQCEPYTITFYSVERFPGLTFDETPTRGNVGRIAAGSSNLPIDTIVYIEGFGERRIADRGDLGARHIDILVQTQAEAIAIGRLTRQVCR